MNCVNKLLKASGHTTKLKKDIWTENHTYYAINTTKKWVANITPYELLRRSLKQAVESIVTLSEGDIFYDTFPNLIETPNYGDRWGRLANYIEINNRAISEMHENRDCCGILSMIKILPAIPPSARSWANCVIISQIFPNIFGDGYNKGPFVEINGEVMEEATFEKVVAKVRELIAKEEEKKC